MTLSWPLDAVVIDVREAAVGLRALVDARARGLRTVWAGPTPGVEIGRLADATVEHPADVEELLATVGDLDLDADRCLLVGDDAGLLTQASDEQMPVVDAAAAAPLDLAAILDAAADSLVVRAGALQLRHGWTIDERGHDPTAVVTAGSNTMTGNGYLGYRGTLAEWGARGYVACIVSDTYDIADGRWTELVSVPNGLAARWSVDGRDLVVDADQPHESLVRGLDIRHGVTRLGRGTADGSLRDQRFASLDDLHAVHQRQVLVPTAAGEVTLVTGIDGDVWSLNGDHFGKVEQATDGALLRMTVTTPERGIRISVAHGHAIAGAEVLDETLEAVDRRIMRRLRLRVHSTGPVEVHTVMAVYSSNDVEEPDQAATESVREGLRSGWSAALAAHAAEWEATWARQDVRIEGDQRAQVALRFGMYHNVIAAPRHTDHLPIGARGLSCQAYQGAAFWDQELFNLPMLLFTDPQVARNILTYRHRTLDGARRKAARLGYSGAFYAWISGDTGDELCPDFFFRDVLTGRPIRNHFNDWQIHVSPDIATTIGQYLAATGDEGFLRDHGLEVLVEIARFLASFVHLRPHDGHYHCIRLLGPDEYHENVDDNAFTNHQVHAALQIALDAVDTAATAFPEALAALSVSEEELARWRDIRDRLLLPGPDPQTGVIEQFSGYHLLEDTTPQEVATRLQDPDEYWGWPNGVAVHTQVIKQADVIQLFVTQPGRFPPDVQAVNLDHYLPRTQHGSSLSRSSHAIVAARLGRSEQALDLFIRGATIDLESTTSKTSGGTFIGGIRTAAAGVSWLVVAQGFLGLTVTADGVVLDPDLPSSWQRLEMPLVLRGRRILVSATADDVTVVGAEDNPGTLDLTIAGRQVSVEPGATIRIAPKS